MGQARTALTARIVDPAVAAQAVVAFGRWVWREKPSLEVVQRVSRGILEVRQIPVPRWARTAQDIHRWLRSLIAKLLRYGAAWWDKLNAAVQRRRLERTLENVRTAVHQAKPCPICRRLHDRMDWREGRNADGKLNCAGWARIKLEDLLLCGDRHGALSSARSPLACRVCGRPSDCLLEGRCPRCVPTAAQPAAVAAAPAPTLLEPYRRWLERLRDQLAQVTTEGERRAYQDLIAAVQADVAEMEGGRRDHQATGLAPALAV